MTIKGDNFYVKKVRKGLIPTTELENVSWLLKNHNSKKCVEEAIALGIEKFLIVTSLTKRSIEATSINHMNLNIH